MINYTPLIFINGNYFKGNFDDSHHLMETFCNSYEYPPSSCSNLNSFQQSHELNTKHLTHFIMISIGICIGVAVLAIILFYIIMKKKIKKSYNFTLNDKINEALA